VRARVVVVAAVLVTAVLVFPRLVPGSLVATFLPWLGLSIPVLALIAWWRRPAIAVLLPLAAWLVLFGPALLPHDAPHDLVAVQHNAADDNPDPAGTVHSLLRVSPDLVALSEILPQTHPAYDAAFGPAYPYRAAHGTVALWSRYPLAEDRLLDIRPRAFGPDWNRGLRAVVRSPHGDIAVYVAHLPSVRMGVKGLGTDHRDESAARLGAALEAESLDRVLLLGDLNGTVHDRGLRPITTRLATADAFAFSFPARAPLARIDQVLARGMTVTSLWSLPRTGSDHLPIAARIASAGH
jgi:vancomycin resistance protein VanJ